MSLRYCMPANWSSATVAYAARCGLLHRIAERSDAQDASAGDPDLAIAIACRAGVKDLAVGMRLRRHAVEALDGIARFRVFGIAACGEHHAERGAPVPFGVGAIERAVDAMLDEIDEIGLEPDHDRLGFGIAQSAVELQDLGVACRIDHHARIEEPSVIDGRARPARQEQPPAAEDRPRDHEQHERGREGERAGLRHQDHAGDHRERQVATSWHVERVEHLHPEEQRRQRHPRLVDRARQSGRSAGTPRTPRAVPRRATPWS